MALIGHKKTDGETQTLISHLLGVSELASEYAKCLGNADWAAFAGIVHDLGKAFPEWQEYIEEGKNFTSINHSEAGAQYAFSKVDAKNPFSKVVPYIVAGHHAGLPDYHSGSGNSLKSILADKSFERLLAIPELKSIFESSLPKSIPFGKNDLRKENPRDLMEHFHLWIRMLFSCLVDSDYIDTESFMTPEESRLRGHYLNMGELKRRFDTYMAEKTRIVESSTINQIRSAVLESCREKAFGAPGFYSLNVPTGGGKTLSSMAFALNHAVANGKKRIIIAIPYTSIIEQTAKVYKYGTDDNELIVEYKKKGIELFGEDNVLEHHCNYDFGGCNESKMIEKQKLATENWDAPIIVTTNVQLFESIFNAHSSSCRKLHNIVDSVIILDEAQMLSPGYLKSILSSLRGLVNCFGVTVVFCTATQPALEGCIGSGLASFKGIPRDQVTPIINKPAELATRLNRVEVNTDLLKEKITDWSVIAEKLCKYDQVLCIVQTRKDCRELHSLMPDGTIHLSALMCAEERSDVIEDIKRRLQNKERIRVISTQLVECGVDIDFPVVFRAVSGIDSIAQSAGRCNREGKLDTGRLFVFDAPSNIPRGVLLKGSEVTKELLELHHNELTLSPEYFEEYFTRFYKTLNDFDVCGFEETMQVGRFEGAFQFRTLSDDYHLIDNENQGSVFVRYRSTKLDKDNLSLLERLYSSDVDRDLFRKLGRYSVNLPLNDIGILLKEGRIIEPLEGIFMQALDDENLYQPGLGLVIDSAQSFSTYVF